MTLALATDRLAELTAEIERLTPAAAYMRQLLDLMVQYPVLLEEWSLFLERAELVDEYAEI